ncbi:MAG: triose-phosphate isomerase [Candidatus Aureabacteria bacterium]|nr:triose-phosphate isomerase [Candidatus Auribacterota bacterium]
MRTPLIAGNWKMHKTVRFAIELVAGLKRELYDEKETEIVVCPPFTALSPVGEIVQGSPIKLGAQDLYWESEGAYTGEISAPMLKEVGCSFVIIGHSERRRLFKETNETVNRKITAAISSGLTPIMCIGETLEKREQGVTDEVLRKQLDASLERQSDSNILKCVIAYEPVWAIGTGRTATPEQAGSAHAVIRLWARERYGKAVSDALRIIYGGSVTPQNVKELMAVADIDGALVGGASLDAASFCRIVRYNR